MKSRGVRNTLFCPGSQQANDDLDTWVGSASVVDWDCDGQGPNFTFVDLDANGALQTLNGVTNEWLRIKYRAGPEGRLARAARHPSSRWMATQSYLRRT